MSEFDVAIVGAGPAGSSTAITLAQRGYRVAMLDRALFPRDKLCGDFLNPINWPVLHELDVGPELLSLPHTKVTTFHISAADGAEATTALPVQEEPQFGLGLRRFHLDHLLLARAKHAGVTVTENVKLHAIQRGARGWRLDIHRGADRDSVCAKILVGADGRNSWVAQQLGLATAPPKHSSAVGFEIQLRHLAGLRGSVEIHQFPGGYAGLVQVDDNTVNLCFAINRPSLGRSLSFDNLRGQFLRRNPRLDELLSVGEPTSGLRSAWPVYFPARRCFGNGFLLVGDAARVTEPLTGEGIFFALKSGQLAGTTLARALADGNLSSVRLSAYDRACRAEFAARLRLNAVIRNLVYRPRLLSLAIRFLGRRRRLLDSLIHAVCQSRAAFDR
jgi:geranylgeranyl reductase family protein